MIRPTSPANNFQVKPLYSAIILAAGNSERMGSPKPLLPYGNGYNFAQHITGGFSRYGCRPVVIVVQHDFDTGVLSAANLVAVVNRHVERGRSHSIHLGLQSVPVGASCFIHNIDNPFPFAGLLGQLLKSVPPDGYAVPVFQGRRGHPLLLGGEMAGILRAKPEITDFRLAISGFTRVEVPCADEHILMNINTPDEYREFLQG
ncbi:MAG: NTP transferase domain-containing protein [Bacteroidota bacterium]